LVYTQVLLADTRRESLFLEQFLIHLSLDDHKRGIDEGALEKLALEHPDKIFYASIGSRRVFLGRRLVTNF
jgi:hypothetical protein